MEQFEKRLVSIIIPVFNRENLLRETLGSILAQTYPLWECIIVDDGSTDSSLNIAKEYGRIDSRFKVYSRPWYKKKGANTCRNYGFELSKGEFIQWFDSDDIMLNEMIQNKVVAFQTYNSEVIICGASFFYSNNDLHIQESDISLEPKTDNPAFEYFAGNFWFGTPQAMFQRKIISSLPYIFNPKLKRNQETELYVRLLLGDLKISYINENFIFVRLHRDSISGIYDAMSYENKMNLDFDAYVTMFLAFKKAGKLTNDVSSYFSDYFLRCLKKMKFQYFKLIYLYIFGNYYSLFPSLLLSTRILIYRYRKKYFKVFTYLS